MRLGKQSNIWQNRNNIFVCLQTYIFRKWGTRKLHIKYKEQMERQHFFWKINERLNLLVSNIDNEPWRSSDRYKNGSIYQWEQKTCNVASKDRLLFSIIILSFYGGFRPSWDYILLKNSEFFSIIEHHNQEQGCIQGGLNYLLSCQDMELKHVNAKLKFLPPQSTQEKTKDIESVYITSFVCFYLLNYTCSEFFSDQL